MNSQVKTEDFKFNQLQKSVKLPNTVGSIKQHARRETIGERLAGWSESNKIPHANSSINNGNISRISPVKPRPLPLDLKQYQSIDLKSRESKEPSQRLNLSPVGSSSKKKPLRGLNFTKDFPTIIVHDQWLD